MPGSTRERGTPIFGPRSRGVNGKGTAHSFANVHLAHFHQIVRRERGPLKEAFLSRGSVGWRLGSRLGSPRQSVKPGSHAHGEERNFFFSQEIIFVKSDDDMVGDTGQVGNRTKVYPSSLRRGVWETRTGVQEHIAHPPRGREASGPLAWHSGKAGNAIDVGEALPSALPGGLFRYREGDENCGLERGKEGIFASSSGALKELTLVTAQNRAPELTWESPWPGPVTELRLFFLVRLLLGLDSTPR